MIYTMKRELRGKEPLIAYRYLCHDLRNPVEGDIRIAADKFEPFVAGLGHQRAVE